MFRRAVTRLAAPVRLSQAQVTAALGAAPALAQWRQPAQERQVIQRDFEFADFHASWRFMSALVPFINAADHHPEWFNVYNKVNVTLATHDCGGVSEKDIALAAKMEEVAAAVAKE
jgi:4a-hydroxytetrahydrobiopterin dehydratase